MEATGRTTAFASPPARMRNTSRKLVARLRERSPYDKEAGTALVEFAILLPLLLVILFGMLDIGRAFNYWIDETHLSNEAARWAAVNKNPGPGGTLQQTIRQETDTAELRNGGTASVPNPLQVCISFPSGTSNVGDPVRVTVSTTYKFVSFLTNKLSLTDKTISTSSTMRLEAIPTNYSAGCA
jgi:Flp pilus assembly protein TadG